MANGVKENREGSDNKSDTVTNKNKQRIDETRFGPLAFGTKRNVLKKQFVKKMY